MSSLPALSPARPTRRAVARGAAWAVPVVAVGAAAPYAAASHCPPYSYVLDWGGVASTYTRTNATNALATTDPDGAGATPAVGVTIESTLVGGIATGQELTTTNQNLRVAGTNIGGSGRPGLQFQQHPTATNRTNPSNDAVPQRTARQEVKFTFSRAVVDLRFSISDIDGTVGDFLDRVELTTGFTYTYNATYVAGAGTLASPFRPTAAFENFNAADTASTNNVAIRYAGPITTFTMTYWSAATYWNDVDRDQTIFLTNMAFDVTRSTC